jgi:ERCC4-type nuclease
MKVVIDCREKKFLELNIGFEFESRALEIGDFQLQDDNFTLLIERKTWSDLHSSIKDNRFREQRSRLLNWREDHQESCRFIYIIEGLYDFTLYQMERGALERLMIAYQIPVLFTGSMTKTHELLLKWSKMSSLEPLFRKRDTELDQIESRLKQRTKKNYHDAKLFFLENLCSIRGISVPMAQSIALEFSSISTFVIRFHNNPVEWMKIMKQLTYKTSSGNEKKFASKIINVILENFDLEVHSIEF